MNVFYEQMLSMIQKEQNINPQNQSVSRTVYSSNCLHSESYLKQSINQVI